MIEELNNKIKNSEPALVVRAIEPTFPWDTAIGYLQHCADNEVGGPVDVLTYKLPYANQIDSITPVYDYLRENIEEEVVSADLYVKLTTKTESTYTGKNGVLIWNVLGDNTLALPDVVKDIEAGDLIYIPKETEFKLKPKEANAFVVFGLGK